MIIGIDASRANRQRRTGTEWYSFYLIEELLAIDKKNQYILYLDQPPSADFSAALAKCHNFKFKVLAWPWPFFWTLGRLSLEMLFKRPDVLFVPAHGLPFFCPKKTLTTVHDIAFVRNKNLYRQEKLSASPFVLAKFFSWLIKTFTAGRYRANSLDYLDWSTRRSLRVAKKVIAVSQATKDDLLSHYLAAQAEKIVVIHNGYNNKLYRPLKQSPELQEVLLKYGLITPYFLYVGRLEKKKNTPLLLEALAIAKENHSNWSAKLALVGHASFGYDEVKYVIEEFNLMQSVEMPGWVPEEEMPFIFAGALAFVFPSRHEGFGIPVLQAMACGVPVIASDLPVLREVAGEAALYFNPDDRYLLAALMAKLLKNDQLRTELSRLGLKQATNFSWRQCAQKTLALITTL